MSFIWPRMLFALLLVPVLVGAYVVFQRRRAKAALDLGTLGFARTGDGHALGWRRHVPFAIFMAAITLLIAGFSRPEMVVELPRVEGSVILAFDNSNSMLATDVAGGDGALASESASDESGPPTRMDVAKRLAVDFVERQPATVRIGIVSFSNGGVVLQPQTGDRTDVLATIDRLQPDGGTSIGQGLFTALSAVTEAPIPITDEAIEAGDVAALDIGFHSSAVIVLLSDGENTNAFDPISAARLAANSGVRIFPVGLGSTDGTILKLDGFSVATSLNEPLLFEIASISDGQYFGDPSVEDFDTIYDSIDLELTVRGDEIEITSLLAAAAALLLLTGAAVSMLWLGRAP